jgi:hypothetical protein
LLSGSNEIYTHPTTVFTFHRGCIKARYGNLLEKYEIEEAKIASGEKLLEYRTDILNGSDVFRYGDEVDVRTNEERVMRCSLQNREDVVGSKLDINYSVLPSVVLG